MKSILNFIKKHEELICLVLAFLIGICMVCDIALKKNVLMESFEDGDEKDWWFLEKCPDDFKEEECKAHMEKQKVDWNKKFDIYKTRFSLDKLIKEDQEGDGLGGTAIKKMIGDKYNVHTHKQNNLDGVTDPVKIESSLATN